MTQIMHAPLPKNSSPQSTTSRKKLANLIKHSTFTSIKHSLFNAHSQTYAFATSQTPSSSSTLPQTTPDMIMTTKHLHSIPTKLSNASFSHYKTKTYKTATSSLWKRFPHSNLTHTPTMSLPLLSVGAWASIFALPWWASRTSTMTASMSSILIARSQSDQLLRRW